MLSSVLNSKTAIEVNIRIIRVFTRLREYALIHKEILLQLSRLEKEVKGNSQDIENIFTVLRELIEKQSSPPARGRLATNVMTKTLESSSHPYNPFGITLRC
jgi:hypothetical protein